MGSTRQRASRWSLSGPCFWEGYRPTCWAVRPRVGLVRALVRPGRDDAQIVGARPVRPAQQPPHHLGEFFPADQRRALLVQQQQILRAAEQAVLHVQIGQRNHSPLGDERFDTDARQR